MENEHINDGEKLSPEWLEKNGFYLIGGGYHDDFHPYNFDYPVNEGDQLWMEKEFDRRRFAVLFAVGLHEASAWHVSIHVQEDAGCDWVDIPGAWCEWSVKQLQYLYEAIRGHKLLTF